MTSKSITTDLVAEKTSINEALKAFQDLEKNYKNLSVYLNPLDERLDHENTLYTSEWTHLQSDEKLVFKVSPRPALLSLLKELSDIGYKNSEQLKVLQTWVSLSESKLTTGNDMTTLARSNIINDVGNMINRYTEMCNAAGNYINTCCESCRLSIKHPGLRDGQEAFLNLTDRNLIQDVRYLILSLTDKYRELINFVKHNKDTIMKLKENESNY